jgi:hypothetical protein
MVLVLGALALEVLSSLRATASRCRYAVAATSAAARAALPVASAACTADPAGMAGTVATCCSQTGHGSPAVRWARSATARSSICASA